MYANKLVVAAKANGKVLREFGETVYIPFGTEYSLLIKNKNTVRASVKVEIDGVDVTEGVSLVIDPNDEIELERFIRNGNLDRGNRFKFIERTQKIAKHRGISAEDGLVRITYQFERVRQVYLRQDPWYAVSKDGLIRHTNDGRSGGAIACSAQPLMNFTNNVSATSFSAQANDVGITAPGSVSEQEFQTVNTFNLEPEKHVIVMRLLGEHEGKAITSSVTTRTRTTCVTCGHRSRTSAKFCSQCGTSLQIID